MKTNIVKVMLWGHVVGYLTWDWQGKVAVFEYEPEFLKQGLDIAPLSMSIHAPRSRSQVPWTGNKEKLFQGLPPMIADSLPDKWGNSLFKAWLRDNNISTKRSSPVDHLSFIGSRAMGALEYVPAQQLGDDSPFSVDVQRLYRFAQQVLDERQSTVLSQENSILWQDLVKISSSPGGKRPKAIVALNEKTGEVVSGQGAVPDGFKHFILKYDDDSVYPFGKLEYIYYRMALDAGIDMMPSQLREYEGVVHFLTERFDRIGNDKVHMQTFAAMSPYGMGYEDIFEVIKKLNLPYEDVKQQFLRTAFNVLARNVDDHSKNFSFIMNREGVWRLSPAYDLTFSVDLAAPGYINRHTFTINRKDEDFTRKDFEHIAIANDVHDFNGLIDQVADAVGNFERYAQEVSIEQALIDKIKGEFVKVRF